jgi:N6-L-threonylcarbamoyladenine synthase
MRPRYYEPQDDGTEREAAVIMGQKLIEGDGTLFSTRNRCHTSLPTHDTHVDSATTLRSAQNDRVIKGVRGTYNLTQEMSQVIRPPDSFILAIETSCDETAAAVIAGNGQLLSNTVASQIDFHARFGGVVPEIASRKHTEAIVGVVDAALEQAGLSSWQNLDALAVTYAPGLIGALVVGVAFAKGLSWATDLPLIRVNHLEGHIYANKFASGATIEPPFIIALLSGGHTMLVHVRAWGAYEILGQTLDDAVGEAFDKVAKALGLGYPGGPVISRLAEQGDAKAIDFPRALLHSHDYRFSLSGLKTAVITYIKKEQASGRTLDLSNIAASFQQAVIDVQVAKALTAFEETGCTTFCLGGGVAANRALRDAYTKAMERRGIHVVFPPNIACTDNAAMIALVAQQRFAEGRFMELSDDAFAHADLEQAY